MRYPILTIQQVEKMVGELARGAEPSCDAAAIYRGAGETVSFDELDEVTGVFKAQLEKLGSDPTLTADKEPFEGALAIALLPFFESTPVEVLDDPGFWRFLSMSRFWWFIRWRESKPIERGNAMTYVDARSNTESVPLRLFLRAKSVAGSDHPELAKELTECTDFWRSHITRVRTSTAPSLAAAMAEMQKDPATRLTTEPLRAFARRINRLWTNVHLSVYDPSKAAALVEELRP